MYKIVKKRRLAENAVEFVINAPNAAANAKAGQFVMLRLDERGERVPFTICDSSVDMGTITILVQSIGYTTKRLCAFGQGDFLADVVGPLGNPTDLSECGKTLLIGGGIGAAVVYPQAKFLKSIGKSADIIIGARNKSLIMYEREFRALADKLYITTDDGSYGEKGFVTDVLRRLLTAERFPSMEGCPSSDRREVTGRGGFAILAVGPLPMMRAVCGVTKEYGVNTIVSMNSIMVDGTGMCGCCRVTVSGETKYSCVDGPEFDGHLIDWDEAVNRSANFKEIEQEHNCRLK